jgi:uncharacterized protein involved in exopolysaccharide biosynthesis
MNLEPRSLAPLERDVIRPGRSPEGLDQRLDLGEIGSILKRRRGVLIRTFAGMLFVAVAYLSVVKPVYTANVQLLVEPSVQRAGDDSFDPDPLPPDGIAAWVESQVQVIESNAVLGQVVKGARLDRDPEFTQSSRLSAIAHRALHAVGIRTGPLETPEMRALRKLQQSVNTWRAEKSLIINLSVSSSDPRKAAYLANAVAGAYLSEQITARTATAMHTAASLSAQLPGLGEEVLRAEEAVETYKYEHSIANPAGQPWLGANSVLIRLRELERNLDSARTTYDLFLKRARAAELADFLPVNSRIISGAELPDKQSWPSRTLILALGAVAGLGFGSAAALARDHLDQRVFTKQQIEDAGLPVLLVVPRFNVSPGAFFRFRDALRVGSFDGAKNVVLITSPGTGEGKTTIASSLAAAATKDGDQVLLVPVVDDPSIWPAAWVSSLRIQPLARTMESAVLRSAIADLERQAQTFDLTIVDCGAARDDKLFRDIASIAGRIILVVRAGETRMNELREVVEVLGLAANRVVGVVLTFAQR